jgi:hypothetical protein
MSRIRHLAARNDFPRVEPNRLVAADAIVRIAKELTRIASGLLVSRHSEAIQMAKPKTHFEQVPLEIIKKIVEEEIPPEAIIKQDRSSSNKKPKKPLLPAEQQANASRHTPFQMELTRP